MEKQREKEGDSSRATWSDVIEQIGDEINIYFDAKDKKQKLY